MQGKKLKYKFLIILGIYLNTLNAQQAVTVSGGYASRSGNTMCYSVGQIEYTTNTGTNGLLSQGVQQIYGISIATGTDYNGINLSYKVYPNPVTNFLILEIDKFESQSFNLELFDNNGRIIYSKKVLSNVTIISMNELIRNAYILKIKANEKEVKSFKIIKY